MERGRSMSKNKNKDTLSEFIIIRVSVSEKIELRKKAQDSKNLSKYIRHVLKLDEETFN